MPRILIPMLVSAALLAGCGGGSAGSAGSAKTLAPPKSASPTSTAVATASQTPTSPAVTATTAAPRFSGNAGSSWCDLVRSLQDSQKFQNIAKDPRAWVSLVHQLLPQAEAKAPGPIKSDMATLAAAIRMFVQVVVTDNYDFSKVTATQLTTLQAPKLEAASQRITAYDQQVCGTKG